MAFVECSYEISEFLTLRIHSSTVRSNLLQTLDDYDFTVLAAVSVLSDLIERCPPAEACRDALERMAKATYQMCATTGGFGNQHSFGNIPPSGEPLTTTINEEFVLENPFRTHQGSGDGILGPALSPHDLLPDERQSLDTGQRISESMQDLSQIFSHPTEPTSAQAVSEAMANTPLISGEFASDPPLDLGGDMDDLFEGFFFGIGNAG